MILFRIAIFLLLLAAGVYFVYYIYTGQQRYKTSGLKILKWTIVAALGFFGVLILERLLQG
jgi:4-hydroxybenzoate polyprenyltransferase